MAKITISGVDDLVTVLNRLSDRSEGIVKQAVFKGSGIIADTVRSNIHGIRVGSGSAYETKRRTVQKAGLLEGLTTFSIKPKGNKIEGGVGFGGYNEIEQANQKVARIFNSGTSFSSKQPFFSKAVRSSRGAAKAAVIDVLESEIDKITKG